MSVWVLGVLCRTDCRDGRYDLTQSNALLWRVFRGRNVCQHHVLPQIYRQIFAISNLSTLQQKVQVEPSTPLM